MQVTCLKDIGNRWKMFEPKREAQDGKSEEDDLENRELGHEITSSFIVSALVAHGTQVMRGHALFSGHTGEGKVAWC